MQPHLKKLLDGLGIDSSREEFSAAELETILQATNRKLNEDRIKKQEKLNSHGKMVEAVAHSFPGLVYWIGSDLTYIGVNRNVPCPPGVKHSQLIGTYIGEQSTDQFLLPVLTSFFGSDRDHYSWDAKILEKGVPKWYHLTASKYGDGRASVVFGFDVTDRRELEIKVRNSEESLRETLEELNSSNTKLSYAQKMEALGEMADAIAHEINNPLAIINGRASLIMDYLDQGEFDEKKFKVFIKSICNTTQRIAKIVGSLKAFARTTESDAKGVFTMQEILRGALERCSTGLTAANISCKINGMSPNFRLECRPKQLEQVFVNFIENSSYAVKELEDKWIEIDFCETKSDIRVKISDSGSGIEKETALKIFQPFYTTKDIGEGAGLGLSVSKGIVDDHGGTIGLDFSKDHTCFIVTFPKLKAVKAA